MEKHIKSEQLEAMFKVLNKNNLPKEVRSIPKEEAMHSLKINEAFKKAAVADFIK